MDLPEVLPDFDLRPYSHLLHSLRKKDILVIDLISLDPVQIAKRCPLPLRDVQRLVSNVIDTLRRDFAISAGREVTRSGLLASTAAKPPSWADVPRTLEFVSTLDEEIDKTLGGGFPAGYVSEIVGESAVGKTQLVLALLLSAQLPSPRGLGKSAIHISTEAPLNTKRLKQILDSHPFLQQLPKNERPTFDRIHSLTIHDFKAQQGLIENHLPHAIEQYDAALVVIDSVAANFRAYYDSASSIGLIQRATELIRLGGVLRRIARARKIAVVITNQVSDRFVSSLIHPSTSMLRTSSPAPSSTRASHMSLTTSKRNSSLSLDHQQRFFTGWGDETDAMESNLKNPTLGLAWANQISARVVLKLGRDNAELQNSLGKRRRSISLVFSPWSAPTSTPLEYSIQMHGITHLEETKVSGEYDELLDEDLWVADATDEEFP